MRQRPLCSICLILFIVLSIIIHTGGAEVVKELRPSALEENVNNGANIWISGEIYQKEIKEEYQILYLKNNSCIYQEQSFQESKLIINDESKQKVNIGNIISVNGEVSFYQEDRNPGNFNQKLYYQKQDIHASLWADSVEVLDGRTDRLKEGLFLVRNRWAEMLCKEMGETDGGILSAMILGEKGEMDQDVKELYQVNGIGHILAISGLHLSFIGVGMYKILRRLTGSYAAGGLAGITFLVCYIFMIGLTVSAVRALIMFLFRVGADMVGRHYDSLTALSAAAVAVILWRPLYLYDGGFWLSFGAVLAVVIVLPLFHEMPFQSIWASVSINLVLLPIQLYYFFEFPLYSIVLNLWVIPLMSVVMFVGMAGSVVTGILESTILHGAGDMILHCCKWIFWVYEKSCEIALKLPGARIVTGKPEVWQVVGYYLVLVSVLLWWKRINLQVKKCKWLIAGVWLFSIVILINPLKNYGKVMVTVLDVGQGDGIFICGPKGTTCLVDGGSSDIKKVGQYRMEPFLKSQGVRTLDYVFVTHGDSDHTSGIEEMIERRNVGIEIETIVFPYQTVWDESLVELASEAMRAGIRVVTIEKGQFVSNGEMKLTCLAPDEQFSGEAGNAASMVLALSYKGFDMLLTGDVEAEGEEKLTQTLQKEYRQRTWEVLKVAHHGSKNSSSSEFLEVLVPKFAMISAGQDNRYGHPHQETVDRLEEPGSEILSTQECGSITVMTDGEKMEIREYVKKICIDVD